MTATVVNVARQYWSYLLRLFWERRTYRTAMILAAVSTIVGLGQFAFLGVFLQRGNTFAELQEYGGSVAAFMISGTVFTGFVAVALSGFSSSIQEEQVSGTLEAVADSPAGLVRVMSFSAATGFVGTVAGAFLMMGGFSWVLGFDLRVNYLAAIMTVALVVVVLGGFGMAGCGIVLVTKRGDPVTWVVVTSMTLLSGILYPVAVLPSWLQTVAELLPTTVALHLLRSSLLSGSTLSSMLSQSGPLVLWAVVSVPLGVGMLRWGLRAVRRRGSIGHF